MGDSKDDESDQKRRIGRDGISRDQQGNAVWKWAADSGRHLIESTSALLKRLEVPGLRLEEDATGLHKPGGNVPGGSGSGSAGGGGGGGGAAKADAGYDPYGGSKRTGAASPARPAVSARPPAGTARPGNAPRPAAAARPAATKPAAALPPRRSWWQRLFGRD